jgi:hypothetical protein
MKVDPLGRRTAAKHWFVAGFFFTLKDEHWQFEQRFADRQTPITRRN